MYKTSYEWIVSKIRQETLGSCWEWCVVLLERWGAGVQQLQAARIRGWCGLSCLIKLHCGWVTMRSGKLNRWAWGTDRFYSWNLNYPNWNQTNSTAAFNWLGLLYRYAAVVLMLRWPASVFRMCIAVPLLASVVKNVLRPLWLLAPSSPAPS